MVIKLVIAELNIPKKKLVSSSLKFSLVAVNRPAPKIIGSASKKENLAAESLFNPTSSPAAMVMPDRDMPGIIAIACAKPIKIQEKLFNSKISLLISPFLSEKNRIIAPIIKAKDIIKGLRKEVWATSLRKKPAIAAGIVAKAIFQNNLFSFEFSLERPLIISFSQSLKKYIIRASKVPMCNAISKLNP